MSGKKKGTIFRVTGLRAERSDENLNMVLRATIIKNLSDDERRHRFTTAIVPSPNDDQQRVALVEFLDGVPGFLHELVADPLKEWQTEVEDGDINFDQHFFGFTQLYTPDYSTKTTADIIAITDLDMHAYGSWRGNGPLGRMWLRDFLFKDLPYCRTMIYGYNSLSSSPGTSKIIDYGRELLEELKKARQRPLYFVAHGFGGIILAHCLIKAIQTNEDDHPTIASLHRATYGMLLFGVPHKGLVVDDMQMMLNVKTNHPRSALIQEIGVKSDVLAYQLVDFKNLIRDRKVISFYETQQTRHLEFNSNTKCWERTGPRVMVVNPDSALLHLPDSMEEKLPVDGDHYTIVKFDSKTSKTYTSVLEKLRQFEKDAPKVILTRFATSGSPITIQFQGNPGSAVRNDIMARIRDNKEAASINRRQVSLIGYEPQNNEQHRHEPRILYDAVPSQKT
ncbi:hypothetical protein NW768_011283 [Fusarium equiseti]|uniref:Uncharacterized protein n=1 Tax=Fusarium equiseti TaxID=61235 RepID=A0ABQ8QXS1_FUSEQ|nr:hypothetical protein NW768_011283 [Fusarium equiseti]